MVCGDGGVGRDALAYQCELGKFKDSYGPVIEERYRTQRIVQGIPFILNILVLGGQEEFSSIRDQVP